MNGVAGGCLVTTSCGLIIYRNRLSDRWVVQISTLVEQGDIDLSLPVRQSVEYIVSIGCTNNLSPTMGGSIGWESGVYSICPWVFDSPHRLIDKVILTERLSLFGVTTDPFPGEVIAMVSPVGVWYPPVVDW